MHPLISNHRNEIANLCRQFGVLRLDVFGSVLREDFNPHSSDVDVVVEFAPAPAPNSFRQYFGLKAKLEALLGRPVDIVEMNAMPSTRLRRIIERSKVPVYAASISALASA